MIPPKFLTLVFAAAVGCVAPAFGAAIPKSIHLEERGHLNEVPENIGTVYVTVVREGSLAAAASVRFQTIDRIAKAGLDYGAVNQVVLFPPNVARQYVGIPIIADSIKEGNERFRIKLTEPVGGILDKQEEDTRESIYINDGQDNPANDQFANAKALEGPKGSLTASNKGASREAGEPLHKKAPRNRSVWFTYTAPGTGFAKFTSRNSTFTTLLAAYTGQSVGGLTRLKHASPDDSVDPDDSDAPAPDDSNDQANIRIKAGQVYRIAVDDSDDAPDDSSDPADSDDSDDGHGGGGRSFLLTWKTILPGKVQFIQTAYSVNETAGSVKVKVTRTGGSDGAVSIHYRTANLTAFAGDDYDATAGTLSFAAGQTVRYITIPVTDDGIFEQAKKFKLTLSHPAGGVRLGLSQTKITIISEDPFTPGRGKYSALVVADSTFANKLTGLLTVKDSATGLLTGKLQLGGFTYVLSGQFDGNNHLSITKPRPNQPPLIIDLQLSADGAEISGTVQAGLSSSSFTGARNAYNGVGKVAPQAGRYTVVLPGDDLNVDTGFPKGDGWARAKVSTAGTGRLTGTLADGTKFSAAFALNDQGQSPIYASLYGRNGSLSGDLTFDSTGGTSDANGSLFWFKRAKIANTPYYPGGFSVDLPLVGSRFKFIDGKRFLASLNANKGNALLTFGEGNLTAPLTQTIKISPQNVVTSVPPAVVIMSMSINAKTGVFTGYFHKPASSRIYNFSGVALQTPGTAAGFFLGNTESGYVRLEPAL